MSEQDVYIWTTRCGEEIPVTEMSDGHLENALAFVQGRKAHFCGLLLTGDSIAKMSLSQFTTAADMIYFFVEAELAFVCELLRRKLEATENG